MSPFAALARSLNYRAYQDFIDACENPKQAQDKLWVECYSVLSNAPYWQKRDIHKRKDLNDFPISTYEDYRSALETDFHSTISPLSGKPLVAWARSTGTTNAPKMFPLTQQFLDQHRRTLKPLFYEMVKNRPAVSNGKVLFFPSPATKKTNDRGVEIGLFSNLYYRNMSPLVRLGYVFPVELLADEALYDDWSPYFALAQNIAVITAVTPSRIINMLQRCRERKDKYLRVMKGIDPYPSGLPKISVSKEQIARVEMALSSDRFSLKDIWPNLTVMSSWKTSTCSWQLKELEPYLSPDVLYMDAQFSATEGAYTVPFMRSEIGGRFHAGSIIVEFLEFGKEAKPENLLKPWQLKAGGLYETFLTTTMGVVRYRLFDVLKVVEIYKNVPVLSFQFRADNSVSLGQTRFSEENLLKAVNDCKLDFPFYWVLAPATDGRGLVFWTQEENEQVRKKVAELDQACAEVNPAIRSEYNMGFLRPMAIHKIKEDHPLLLDRGHGQNKRALILKTPMLHS